MVSYASWIASGVLPRLKAATSTSNDTRVPGTMRRPAWSRTSGTGSGSIACAVICIRLLCSQQYRLSHMCLALLRVDYSNRSFVADVSLSVAGDQSLPLASVEGYGRSLASAARQVRAQIADVDLARTRRVVVVMQARSRRRSAGFDSHVGAEVRRTIRVDFY